MNFVLYIILVNEVFQVRTMIFVNQISDIVHSCIDIFNGITNKNLGDCYLLSWKFKEKTEKDKDKENDIKSDKMNSNLSNEKVEELTDCAILGYLKIIKKIKKYFILKIMQRQQNKCTQQFLII